MKTEENTDKALESWSKAMKSAQEREDMFSSEAEVIHELSK